ncbi:MAG: methylmalonyl-CoA epimerase [Myxococcota bacterium]|jgi:methylmalonyl-CoA/ethylmalonyl-CoA epimerase|nr:methylmalonyl-CoA epimerase [Myxococcota bacterium]
MDIEYLGVDHLGLAVKDLAAAEATYRNILGFKLSGSESLPDRGLEVRFVETGNARIELIAPTRDDSEVSRFLDKRGEGLHHICLQVASIDRAIAQLRAQGAQLLSDEAQSGAEGSRVVFIHPKGTHGVLMELVEKQAEEES